ncbi:cell wall-active antibiotics response protein LiaF [Bacillus massilinigeriensis]|uniref:cell wall-active antibiotics response protein LiaF n=1 Tax=Bacillus massilionigeriensis TaxID=1805475 RepID=UPI00096AEBB1|nr:cell wall-active antibiotics response protein LiaF [Bacillus massilionigeriensis]
MFKNKKSDFIGWSLLIGAIVLLLEVSFFNHGLIFSLLVAAGLIYLGRKRKPKGKLLFWAGVTIIILNVFSMMTFRFLLIAILVYLFIQYGQSKKKPETIRPIIKEPSEPIHTEGPIIKKEPLLENNLFGTQKTPEHVYEWDDINIQTGIGDTVIDLSYTVMPKGDTVIFIKNFIGNIQILVPYDLEVSINHSVIAGSTSIFDYHESRLLNHRLHFQTSGFENAEQRIKIFTSLLIGDIEVKRI